MSLLDLGFRSGGHPPHSAYLHSNLFGALDSSGCLCEPWTTDTIRYPLPSVADRSEITPEAGGVSDLAGRVTFRRESWDFAGESANPFPGGVLSKSQPDEYLVEASAFSALSLGQDIVNNINGGVSITGATLSAGADPEAQVLITATIVDVV